MTTPGPEREARGGHPFAMLRPHLHLQAQLAHIGQPSVPLATDGSRGVTRATLGAFVAVTSDGSRQGGAKPAHGAPHTQPGRHKGDTRGAESV